MRPVAEAAASEAYSERWNLGDEVTVVRQTRRRRNGGSAVALAGSASRMPGRQL